MVIGETLNSEGAYAACNWGQHCGHKSFMLYAIIFSCHDFPYYFVFFVFFPLLCANRGRSHYVLRVSDHPYKQILEKGSEFKSQSHHDLKPFYDGENSLNLVQTSSLT